MKKNDKPYWKESLECYLFIFIVMSLFIVTFIVSGQLTGTNWITYFKQFSWEVDLNEFKELFLKKE